MRAILLATLVVLAATFATVASPAASACPTPREGPPTCGPGATCVAGKVCVPVCVRTCPEAPAFTQVCTLRPLDKGTMVCVAPSDPTCTVAIYQVDGPHSSKACVPL